MEGGIKDESKKESPLGQIDPECIREALKTFFKPAKANDPQVDFYTIYKKEANEYDTDYIKKYEEDLTTTLLFAGLFSAVNSVFVIDVYSKLQPNPNAQSTALLHAILLTLNHSAIPDETFLVSTTQKDYPPEVVAATCLLYASLLLSLLAAFGAMLGKQWLDRYFRHAGGSMIERSGDRQRKCDGLIEGKFHFFIEALPVMLQIALLFLVCGLYTYMASINTSAAFTLITLVGLGALFYLVVLIAGTVWNDCPFQTPASDLLRFVGKKLRPHFVTLWRTIWPKRYRNWIRIPQLGQNAPHHRHQGPDQLTIREDLRLHSSWFTPDRLKTFRLNNANNARCVSWILRYITDPEARDAAIRLAGIIWWFEDGIKVKPLYKSIVSTFRTCFGSNMELFPKMRDRAYYSGQAILWIYTLAVCKSMEDMFPLPTSNYTTPESDPDLTQLLSVFQRKGHRLVTKALLHVDEAYTPLHSQWISRILLHLSWPSHAVTLARFDHPDLFKLHLRNVKPSTPLDAVFNRLLMCCNLLGTTVGDEVLKIEDKSSLAIA
ncbi:hypothetical protein BJ322DRAFT_553515 [Thelephora terrestris]|uniref:DUF6535 domain-containing protein n=1 Tax=Thelephora terrestris TaxID=56493 RepID=A0A9P6HLR9_9AGAM|nr:hypothetical protein BJ322DRAFT_553515 [Thelephora terrestris]